MPIYADANATYPVAPEHYDHVIAILKESDGNPSSIHGQGRKAKVALEDARSAMAAMIGSKPAEVVFTSGATESNNMVITGVIKKCHAEQMKRPHVLVSAVEHRSVIEPAKILADRGEIELEIIPVNRSGHIESEVLQGLLRPETALVCMMYANNEIGSINDIKSLIILIRSVSPKAHIHSDAVQLLGKADLTWLGKSGIDSASFSGHKIGAFKGIGSVFIRSGSKLSQFMSGGGQERGRRPGTENMPGIVSFGIRCREVMGKESLIAQTMLEVRKCLLNGIKQIKGGIVHGSSDDQWMLPNTVHFHVEELPGDDIILNFDLEGIQVSSGSACSSGSSRPSHVVMALGYDEWVALNSIRISFSSSNSPSEAEKIISVLQDVSQRVRGYV
jgi:cysteine desulfurase